MPGKHPFEELGGQLIDRDWNIGLMRLSTDFRLKSVCAVGGQESVVSGSEFGRVVFTKLEIFSAKSHGSFPTEMKSIFRG